MESVIRTLDELVEKKIIIDYAIGGATALMYFSAPTLTEDIDVFVYLPQGRALVDLSPVYEHLRSFKGARVEREYVFVDGFPVQILVPYDALSEEAFRNAIRVEYGGIPVKILPLEYLIAIMIQLDRPKYRDRLRVVFEEHTLDEMKLKSILRQHLLTTKWENLRKELGV